MLFSKSRDYKLRKSFFLIEQKIKINKFIFINLLNSFSNKAILLESLNNQKKKLLFLRLSKVRLVRHCLLTNRKRSVYKSHSLSRNILKELMQFGVAPGYRKAVW